MAPTPAIAGGFGSDESNKKPLRELCEPIIVLSPLETSNSKPSYLL
jgi:hypothetical protein